MFCCFVRLARSSRKARARRFCASKVSFGGFLAGLKEAGVPAWGDLVADFGGTAVDDLPFAFAHFAQSFDQSST